MTWRPTPNGQPACSMRRRRSWRPNGYACSRTRPCGSVNSPTSPPTFLHPGPARPASARPPPRGGGQANRCHTTVAGGRRGDGPRRRYGRPKGLLRSLGEPAERHCRTREVMPAPMITSRQRRPVPATMTPMSRHRCRLQGAQSVDARTATGGGMSKWTRAPRRCDARAGRRTAAGSVLRPPGPLAHNALVILLSAAQAS